MERRGMSVPMQIAIGLVLAGLIVLSPSLHIGRYTFGTMPPNDVALSAWVRQNYKVRLPKVTRAGNAVEITGYTMGFAFNPFGQITQVPPFATMGYQKPGPVNVSVGPMGVGLVITLVITAIVFDLLRRIWNVLRTRFSEHPVEH